MSVEDELKWRTKRFSWRYIPFRFQAWVATIVSGLLYFEGWVVLFRPTDAGNYACGSLIRPILNDESGDDPVGWIWNIISNVENARCPRTMSGLYSELFFVALGLAVCGVVLRRSIKRGDK